MGYLQRIKERRKESKAYKEIVEKQNLAARRRAYAAEALKVAEEKGKAMARKPSFMETVGRFGQRAITPPARKSITRRAPVRRRRTVARRPIKRRRYAPVKRRVVRRRAPARRYAPVKRRKKVVREEQNANAWI